MKTIKTKIIATVLGCLLSLGTAFASGYGISGNAEKAPANTNANQQASDKNALGGTDVSRQAFSSIVRNIMALSPEQIKTLRRMFDASQKAASTYPGTPPRPTSTSLMVNLSPGATPPVVRLRKGFVTSIVFIDSTGQPWPIQAIDLGNPKGFNIQWDKKGNTLLVQAMDTYRTGNLAVMLKGLNTPVMISLMPGQRAVDYRVDMRIPGMGPEAKPDVSGLPNTGSPQLLDFLNGVPPKKAKALDVSGGEAQAWSYQGEIYLRTRLTVLSPGWISSMSSPDGTNAYELPKTPVVLVSKRGAVSQLSIAGL